MPAELIAQFLGGAGFLLILIAPLVAQRNRFIALDVAGLVPVCIHYVQLGAPVGALLCALYIVMDVVSSQLASRPLARQAYWGFYPAAVLITFIFYGDARDLAALAGTLFAVASRQQSDFAWLKFLIFLSAFGWGLYGILVGSYSQVIFSTIYAVTSLFGTAQELRRRPPPA